MRSDWVGWTGRAGGPSVEAPLPTVPIANLYSLLCYAANHLEARALVDVGALGGPHPAELFAEVLVVGFARLRRRGVPRAYRVEEQDTRVPRGRVELSPTITRGLPSRGQVACTVQELTADIPFNQALKAGMRILAGRPEVSRKCRLTLRRHVVALGPVRDVRPSGALFVQARAARLDGLAEFLLGICERVAEASLIGPEGTGRFLDYAGDPQAMGRLFESFLLGWMRREQDTFRATKSAIPWDVVATGADRRLLPDMEGDILLARPGRRVLLEAKYTGRTLVARPGGPARFRSAHLYQLHTYLTHLARDGGPPPTGVLVYAQVERPLDQRYRLGDVDLRVKSVDLARPWQEVHAALRRLVEELAE